MIKQMSAGAVLSLLLAGAALAAAPGGAPSWQGGGAGMAQRQERGADLTRLQSELAITSTQQAAWNRFAQAIGALHRRPARPAFPATSGLTPAPQIFAAFAERASAKAKEAQKLSAAASALYKELTPKQQAVLDTHLADFMARHRHHWKRGYRSMQGPNPPPPSGG